ncbi:MAG: MFS transporter [Alphaproteobacteria bacterium]|nr:MFS transporter [Alphaproteobacteria bacterium]
MWVSLSSARNRNLFYALPAFVLSFPTIPVFVLLPSYYAEDLGLGLGVVGIALLALRIFDVATDPIVGVLADRLPDRSPNRMGKRKLPMIAGGVLASVGLLALFMPPETVTIWYLVFFCGLLYLGWTLIQIPYLAWSVELANTAAQRNHINAMREGAGLAGILTVGFLMLISSDLGAAEQYRMLAMVTVVGGILLFLPMLRFVPEIKLIGKTPSFSFPRENKLFLRVLIAWLFNGLANGLPAICFPLFLTYILEADDQQKGILIFVYFASAILGIPIWIYLSKFIERNRIWCLSMLIACVSFLFVPFIGAQDIISFAVICIVTGMALGGDLALPPAIQADCADWDRYRHGFDRSSVLFSYWSMSTKLALGLSAGIAFPLLEAAGIQNNPDTISEFARNSLLVIYAALPIVLKSVATGMMWGYPLTSLKQRSVRRALERKL